MTPLLLGNLAASALGAIGSAIEGQSASSTDPYDQLLANLQQTGSGEKTVSHSDGSSVTTVATANGGERVVSETSASGQTLTEAGYVSPVDLSKFLDQLFTGLKSDAAQVAGTASTSVDAAVGKLDTRLDAAATSTRGLVNSFSNLMQSSGIDLPAGSSVSSALKSFLAHAAPAIVSGQITRTGINLRA